MAGPRVISAVLTLRDRNFASGIQGATQGTQDLSRRVQHTGNQVKQFGKNAVSSFANVAKGAAGLAAAFVGITSIGELGSAVIETEEQFDRLAAKTATAGKELAGLKSIAKDVFVAGFGEDMGMVTDSLGTLKTMFGDISNNELKVLAMGSSTIADLWGAEVTEVGTVVKNMTSNFKGLTQTDALDLLTTGFQKTGDYSDDLLDTMKEYSPLFAQLGLDAKDSMGLLIKGAEAGAWNMDKVGDAVKEFGIRGMDGSKASAEGFEMIGLNAKKMTKNIAAGGDSAKQAFNATIAGLAAMKDPVKQSQAGVALFGTQWEDVRQDVILSMVDSADAVEGFEGATKKAQETMHRGFGPRMKTLWRGLKTNIVSAFDTEQGRKFTDALATKLEGIGPLFQKVIDKGIAFAGVIQDHWPKISETISTIKGYIVDIKDGFVGVYSFVKDNWSLIGPVVYGVAGGMLFFKTATLAVTAAVNVWKGVTTAMSIAQGVLNGTLAISPLGWIAIAIGAVIAVGVLLYKNWDTVKAAAASLWEGLTVAWTGIKEGFSNMWSGMKSAAKGGINYVIGGLNKMIKGFNNFASFKVPDWVPGIGGKGFEVNIPTIPAFAKGTNYAPGGPALINERGGEIVDLPSGARVYPHDKSIQMARSEGKGNPITININGVGKSTNEILSELIPALKLALANM